MISRENELKWIDIYSYIFNLPDFKLTLNIDCKYLNNNAKPDSTVRELMTIKLFAGYKKCFFRLTKFAHLRSTVFRFLS